MTQSLIIYAASKTIGLGHACRANNFVTNSLENIPELTFHVFDYNEFYSPLSDSIFKWDRDIVRIIHFSSFLDFVEKVKNYDFIIVDLPQIEYPELEVVLNETNAVTVAIDDITSRRLLVDMNFYPPVPWIKDMDWDSSRGERYIGYEYYPLNSRIDEYFRESDYTKRVAIVFGGTDPYDLTIRFIKSFLMQNVTIEFDMIIGPFVKLPKNLPENLTIHASLPQEELFEVFSKSCMAVCAYGVTVFELIRLQVPAIVVTTASDHVDSFYSMDLGKEYIAVDNEQFDTQIVSVVEEGFRVNSVKTKRTRPKRKFKYAEKIFGQKR